MTVHNPPPTTAPRGDERLAKRVAAMVPCSRREAEHMIEVGGVRVDGQVVEEPMFRVSNQQIAIDLEARKTQLEAVTLLLHRSAGTVAAAPPLLSAANHDPQDASGVRPLKRHLENLGAAAELEPGASGLVVFTQDWRVLRKLSEDAQLIEHEVMVEVAGAVSPATVQRLNQKVAVGDLARAGVKVSVNSAGKTSSGLRFAFKGTHPGLIALLCDGVGLHILKMKRIRIGRVAMGQLPPGTWRYLRRDERF